MSDIRIVALMEENAALREQARVRLEHMATVTRKLRDDRDAALLREAALRRALNAVQWANFSEAVVPGEDGPQVEPSVAEWCPSCLSNRNDGHDPDCWTAKALSAWSSAWAVAALDFIKAFRNVRPGTARERESLARLRAAEEKP